MTRFVIATSSLLKRSLWLIGLVAVVATVVALATTAVLGRADSQTFPGTKAPGSHEWWSITDPEATFCTQCHSGIADELAAGPHPKGPQTCLGCHGAGGNQHAADPAQCVNCHSNEAGELNNDAHAEFYTDLGEDDQTASWTCKACHTKVEIDITTTPMGALQLTQD